MVVENYKIIDKSIYNFDKKEFMIEIGIIFIQIISLKKIRSKEIIWVS